MNDVASLPGNAIEVLRMVIDGRISGRISEWPQLKPAIESVLSALAALSPAPSALFRGLDSQGRPIYGNPPSAATTTTDRTAPSVGVGDDAIKVAAIRCARRAYGFWRGGDNGSGEALQYFDGGYAGRERDATMYEAEIRAALSQHPAAPSVSPAYDRELIARFLESTLRGEQHRFQFTAMSEQARLLREADNAEAAKVGTVAASEDGATLAKGLMETARRLRDKPFGDFTEWTMRASECERAANLIRRLASSAPQGEAIYRIGDDGRLTREPAMAPDMLALLDRARKEYRDSDAAGDVLDWLDEQYAIALTTPPPAPAAEQPQQCPICVGECVHTGNWISDTFKPLPAEEVAALQAVGAPGFEIPVEQPQGEWTEAKLRQVAKDRGWHIRESASVPTEDGYLHPFSVSIPSHDLLRYLSAAPSRPVVDEAMVERAMAGIDSIREWSPAIHNDYLRRIARAAISAALGQQGDGK